MATSTLIQRLEADSGANESHRRQVETFLTGADVATNAIVAGDVVMWDITDAGPQAVMTVIQSRA